MKVFEPYTDQFGVYQKNGRDPYLAFASKMYGIPFEVLYADYKGKNGPERKAAAKRMRQIAKPPVLASLYRMAGGGWGLGAPYKDHQENCDAKNPGIGVKRCLCPEVRDRIKTGLWGYADNMGIEMSQEQAHSATDIFRNSYPEICDPQRGIWKQFEIAVAEVMDPKRPATTRTLGPNGCIVLDRINIEGRQPMMRMRLPSGRYLHYMDARLEPTMMPWKGVDDDGNEIDVYRDSLIYAGTNQKTKQWDIWVSTHGGKLFENAVQGIARDILATSLLKFEERDMPLVGHVHDEGITLVEDDLLSPTVHDMVEIMSTPIDWCPGLLLGADGYQETYYHK
jgi:DNA polymerase